MVLTILSKRGPASFEFDALQTLSFRDERVSAKVFKGSVTLYHGGAELTREVITPTNYGCERKDAVEQALHTAYRHGALILACKYPGAVPSLYRLLYKSLHDTTGSWDTRVIAPSFPKLREYLAAIWALTGQALDVPVTVEDDDGEFTLILRRTGEISTLGATPERTQKVADYLGMAVL